MLSACKITSMDEISSNGGVVPVQPAAHGLHWLAHSISESLLDLTVKLRAADKKINGKAACSLQFPEDITAGVRSCIEQGCYHYRYKPYQRKRDIYWKSYTVNGIRREKDLHPDKSKEDDDVTKKALHNSSEAIFNEPVAVTSVTDNVENVEKLHEEMQPADDKLACNNSFNLIELVNAFKHSDLSAVAYDAVPKLRRLNMLEKGGRSLWPFLSSSNSSSDNELAKFLTNCPQFIPPDDESRMLIDCTRPLTEDDFETILDNAVEIAVASKKVRFMSDLLGVSLSNMDRTTQHSENDNDKTYAELAVSFSCETNASSNPMRVSKRYAAAIANPRRFKCNLCPYSTNNRAHVRRHHISVHSDARPYQCFICGKEFARSENAKVHFQSRHIGIPYDLEKIRKKNYKMLPGYRNGTLQCTDSETLANVDSPAPVDELPPNVITIEPIDDVPERKPELNLLNSIAAKPVPVAGVNLVPANGLLFSNVLSLLANGTGGLALQNAGNVNRWPIDQWLCPHCRVPCKDAADLLCHMASSHADKNVAEMPPVRPSAVFGSATFASAISDLSSNGLGHTFGVCALPANLSALIKNSLPQLNSVPTFNSLTVAPQINPIAALTGCAPLISPVSVLGSCPTQINSAAPLICATSQLNSNIASSQPVSYVVVNNANMQPATAPYLQVPVPAAGCISPDVSGLGQHFRPILPKALGPEESKLLASDSDNSVVVEKSGMDLAQAAQHVMKLPRTFKTFFCSRCPFRAPFRYRKSFIKHLAQHRITDSISGGTENASLSSSTKRPGFRTRICGKDEAAITVNDSDEDNSEADDDDEEDDELYQDDGVVNE